MARIKSPQRSSPTDAGQALVDQLAAALRGEEQAEGPVIFEIAQGESGYLQVVIVWEQWADLPNGARDQVVKAAYRQVESDSPDEIKVDYISLILPVTPKQAVDLSILPYSVQSSIYPDQPDFQRLLPLLRQEGAIHTDARVELRLPTLEMAQKALDRLKAGTRDFEREVRWQIMEQVGRIHEYD